MKIAIVGAIDTPISENSTAGTEIWTYDFAEELVKQGHDVTLFAPEGSQFSGKLHPVIGGNKIMEKGGRGEISKPKFSFFSVREMVEVVEMQDEFDLIHISVFSFHYLLPLTKLIKKPIVLTVHGTAFHDQDMEEIFGLYNQVNYVFISNQFADKWPKPAKHKVIYNGIAVDKFTFNASPEDYYFWMGRISPEKGIEDAIEFAKRSGQKLIMAGPIRDQSYFDEKIQPNFSENIKYVGPANFEQKNDYYKNAKAFLMPVKWDEPFGLVVVEAMACGTPVIAYNRGAMPELIEDEKNGLLVTAGSIDGLINAADKISRIDRAYCRQSVEKKFSLEAMTNSYLEYYGEIMHDNR